MNDEQILKDFYYDSNLPPELVIHYWHSIARLLKVDAGKLRPYDKIYEFWKLKQVNFHSYDVEELETFMITETNENQEEENKISTVDEMIHFIIKNRRAKK
ncbi:MAG: hypothetical protein PHQ23_13725 [Candidatus Wallbacteria bacterium]|nr:hypothetical protein [Candidatus Wallbacteria bacterium]